MPAPFRMTTQTCLLLRQLLTDVRGDHYGFEISKATGLKPGTLYPTLARLENAGWIEGRWESVDPETARRPARRYYRLTNAGATSAIAALAEIDAAASGATDNPGVVGA